MKIYMMTDIEGVAGVLDFDNWTGPKGRYYEQGKKLLTEEVNAAIEGLFLAGADEITVVDGHGEGGINNILLDSRATYSRGWYGPYPFGMDETFDCMVVIGQHAKAGTPYAHLAHTGSTSVLYEKINGIEVGEYGEQVLMSSEIGFPVIFAVGDKALTLESNELTPWAHTVAVKKGVIPGKGDECTAEQYEKRNYAAIHLSPKLANEIIRKEAEKALLDFIENPSKFKLLKISNPYVLDIHYRSIGGKEPFSIHRECNTTIPNLLNGK